MTKHEPVTAASLRMRAVPSCSKCGSSKIQMEAFVQWNERKQSWDVFNLLEGNTVCDSCGQDTEVKWRLEK